MCHNLWSLWPPILCSVGTASNMYGGHTTLKALMDLWQLEYTYKQTEFTVPAMEFALYQVRPLFHVAQYCQNWLVEAFKPTRRRQGLNLGTLTVKGNPLPISNCLSPSEAFCLNICYYTQRTIYPIRFYSTLNQSSWGNPILKSEVESWWLRFYD